MQVGGNELHKHMHTIVRSHNDELSRDTSFGILVVRHKTEIRKIMPAKISMSEKKTILKIAHAYKQALKKRRKKSGGGVFLIDSIIDIIKFILCNIVKFVCTITRID